MANTITNFAFEEVMRMAGGRDEYSQATLAMIYAECENNRQIQELAGCQQPFLCNYFALLSGKREQRTENERTRHQYAAGQP